jgi:heme oxygenase
MHTRLKAESLVAHEGLEQALVRESFFSSIEGYTEYLRRFAAFQWAGERVVQVCGGSLIVPDWERRKRGHLLEADLKALGSCIAGEAISARDVLGSCHSAAHGLGVAYVLEGATLGGAVLLKQVSAIGVTPEQGGSFLASYGPLRKAMWQQFLSTLDSWERRGIQQDQVVRAALLAFRAARDCLIDES